MFLRLAALVLLLTSSIERLSAVDLPGVQPDGSVLLPNQWSLRPAGKQVPLGDFPVNIAIHPDGQFAVVLHAGWGPHELITLTVPEGRLVAHFEVDEAFYGLAFSPDGRRIFTSGAATEVVRSWAFQSGLFTDPQTIRLRPGLERGVPAGMSVAPDGSSLWVTELFAENVIQIPLTSNAKPIRFFVGDTSASIASTPQPLSANPELAAVEKRQAALQDAIAADSAFPYFCLPDPIRSRVYVSLWGKSQVAVVDVASSRVAARWTTGDHPNEMVLSRSGKLLYVANANHNTVTVLDCSTGEPVETLSTAMHPGDPPGTTPNSLCLTPDESLLFVANAGNNNVAVFDLEKPGHSRPLGFIPTGWYPTSVRVTLDSRTLLVANGKGLLSHANRHGPQPGREAPSNLREYIGGLMQGTLSIIPLPTRGEPLEEAMKKHTDQAFKCTPVPSRPLAPTRRSRRNPIPAVIGGPSPIHHVIYIIKENRTYDQMLGDMPEGNGDANLCLFPEAITPNHHQLAREFVLLDNFYVDGEVSADGHEWTVGAYASDFVEKTWPLNYGHGTRGKFPYPSEGRFTIARSGGGYLWDKAREAGVSYRSYGQFLAAGKTLNDPATSRVPALEGHFDPWFRPWDMDYPDVQRADRFLSELRRFEKEGAMPRLQIVRLPNDHTYGTSTGKLSPRAMVADNDLALGRLVEGVSHSRFWPSTAIFVVEDDAQNGPDHVDAHRSIAYAISPYVKRNFRDSTMYSTCSALRTMELILGLRPMSQYDARANPMFNAFQPHPDKRPYHCLPVAQDRAEKNVASAWGSTLSLAMDFSKEDAADDLQLNEVIWRSVKGANSPMPRPRRAAFVLLGGSDDD
ncbi:MAG: YncE family protein [Pedosphaera sp.]|nr:YncE family protein [Pedosphaera sp.]